MECRKFVQIIIRGKNVTVEEKKELLTKTKGGLNVLIMLRKISMKSH